MTVRELRVNIQGYEIASIEEKRRLTAQLLNSLLTAHEAAFLIDKGGVLTDSGSLEPEFDQVISLLEYRPHPPVIIVSPRMVPFKYRRQQDDLSYLSVRSLKRESTERLISRLLKDRSIRITSEQLSDLVKLSDGHPFNIYRMVDEVSERGLEPFLASPTDFIDWKHRQSSEYLQKIKLNKLEELILGLLNVVPELDFSAVVSALAINADVASDALFRLTDLHIVEPSDECFIISPALRVAVERDKRIGLPKELQTAAIRSLSESLSIRLEEGSAPISLVDAAVLSSLESGDTMSALAAAFLLPSHQVWLAKKHYDQRNWAESIRLAREALSGAGRLSRNGFVAACRYMCLAGARIGEPSTFNEGIKKLEAEADHSWAKSNIEFLKGFNSRLKGNLPDAETHFRNAYSLSPGSISAAREIAAICLTRDNLSEAESFAREAYSHASSNAYILDILISVLIRKHGRAARDSKEIQDIFGKLEVVDREAGRSFFATRRAELEHLWGDNKLALQMIEQAINKTPNFFEPRRLHAEILLKERNPSKALESIHIMRDIVQAHDPKERMTNYRMYLQTYAHYLTDTGEYNNAKKVFSDISVFTDAERVAAIREIEIVQAYRHKSNG
jgi:hypothetical protein